MRDLNEDNSGHDSFLSQIVFQHYDMSLNVTMFVLLNISVTPVTRNRREDLQYKDDDLL